MMIEDSNLAHACAKLSEDGSDIIWNTHVPKMELFPMEAFLSIGFSHHRLILSKVKDHYTHLRHLCNPSHFGNPGEITIE